MEKKCSLCGAPNVNRKTCPHNGGSSNQKPDLHYQQVTGVYTPPKMSGGRSAEPLYDEMLVYFRKHGNPIDWEQILNTFFRDPGHNHSIKSIKHNLEMLLEDGLIKRDINEPDKFYYQHVAGGRSSEPLYDEMLVYFRKHGNPIDWKQILNTFFRDPGHNHSIKSIKHNLEMLLEDGLIKRDINEPDKFYYQHVAGVYTYIPPKMSGGAA